MPIRFPTEAANDPGRPLDGMPESTGEDDTRRESERGRAYDRPPLRERGTRETGREESKRESGSDPDTRER